MRLRPLVALSAAAVSALLLAGCSGLGGPDATPSPSESAPAESMCAYNITSGEESDALVVTGTGPDATVEIPEGFAPTEMQRSVVSEGDGEDLGVYDFVLGSYQIINAETGEVLADSTDLSADASTLVPMLMDPQQYSIFVAALECAPLGSQTVTSIPGSAFGDGGVSVVVLAHAEEMGPTKAGGAEQAPVEGMPTVSFAENGAPTVTLPGGDAPTAVQLENLRIGDGGVVEPGDTVFVQYLGVTWSDGTEFDSSWSRNAVSAFSTAGVVAGFKQALEGQTVGSQVVVVIPPEFGYGASEGHALQNETLVFVVDILGVERAATS